MAMETSALLRSILLHANKAKSVREIIKTVEAMCSKEDIDAVYKSLQEMSEESDEGNDKSAK